MAIPVGVSVCNVTLNAPITFIGEAGRVHLEIIPSASLVYVDALGVGHPLGNFIATTDPADGVAATITLPHVDQPGFLDSAGNSYTGWYYTAHITYEKDGQQIALPSRDFQVVVGQASADLSQIVWGVAEPAHSAPIPAVTSVSGRTGAVVLSYNDITGTVPTSALPPLAINDTFPVASEAAMLALVAQRGDVAIRTDTGRTYILATDSPGTLADWKEIMATGQVVSVAGRAGNVVLAKADVGLSDVDNTSDANKPVSTAQSAALALKLDASQKGANSGVAPLDTGGRVPQVNLPAALDPAQLNATYTRRIPSAVYGDMVPVGNRNNLLGGSGLSNGTDTSAVSRIAHLLRNSHTEIRLVYVNQVRAGTGPQPDPITVSASLEEPRSGATVSSVPTQIYPVTFNNGSASVTIATGAFAVSDPVQISGKAGQVLYERTLVTVAAGKKFPTGSYAGNGPQLDGGSQEGVLVNGTAAALFATPGTDSIPAGSAPAYSAAVVIGRLPVGASLARSVGILGTSIAHGDGELFPDWGYGIRMAERDGLPYVDVGVPGSLAVDFTGPAATQRMALLSGVQTVLEEFGRNDVTNGSYPATQIEANKVAIWKRLAQYGIKITICTITPRTNTTDGWKTLAGQSLADPANIEAIRVSVNDWIRDGAPLDPSLVPVAVGTGGALRVGQAGHPVSNWFDAADAVESSRNSGKWKPADRIVTDAGMTSGSSDITSATANFTQADVEKRIEIAGAGPGGSALRASIRVVNSATSVTLQWGTSASTTVSGATMGIGMFTDDGTHPTTQAHKLMAAAGSYA